jgi:hypothetical protein
MKKNKISSFIAFLLITMLFVVTGCSGDKTTPPDNKTLTISLSSTTVTILVSKTHQLTPTVSDPNEVVTWTSNNNSIATVNSSGLVTAIAEGTATITATIGQSISANCTVAVEKPVSVAEVYFEYAFDSEYQGELALPTIDEGEGFVIGDSGWAYTADGSHNEASAPNWTFISGPYDRNLSNYILESKVVAVNNSTSGTPALYSNRICYDWVIDIQLSFNNESWNGVQVYNTSTGTLIGQMDNATKGGIAPEGFALELNTEYIVSIKIETKGTDEAKTSKVTVSVNGVDVVVLEGLQYINPSAKHSIGASAGSHIKLDYFKAISII